ncbi:ATP-binding cassette domain-containing protein [Spiroplasma taiwanense]|uniref:ATP-binding cassette domain-containing protein n=1 Tax=Spiroplasma taiwanense TaxID=2145 RepID=UPI0004283A2B|nr:ABC transporter ATP-binding protein [Spiroplasma taiwanense]
MKLDYLIENSNEGLETQIGGISQKISGGEKQRIALAKALYSDKKFLLLDESTANLDPNTKNEIEKLILEDKQLTVIMISHDFTSENLKLIDKQIELKGIKENENIIIEN